MSIHFRHCFQTVPYVPKLKRVLFLKCSATGPVRFLKFLFNLSDQRHSVNIKIGFISHSSVTCFLLSQCRYGKLSLTSTNNTQNKSQVMIMVIRGNPRKPEGVCPLILQPARKKTPWINISKLLNPSPCTNIILAKTLEIDTGSISLPKFQLCYLMSNNQ